MRYPRVQDILRLIIQLQGTRSGLTIGDIQDRFSVSRSTAERMREAVREVFGELDRVDTGDTRRRWRLRSDPHLRFVRFSAEELTELESAAKALARAGIEERANTIRELADKLRATLREDSRDRIDSDFEALVQAEGLAMRAGPRPRFDPDLLSCLREAIITHHMVEFRYLSQSTGRRSRQRIQPLGLLYGNRAFLVGVTDWSEEPRLWRLANMSEARVTSEAFEPDPAFNLEQYAKRSFGTFQEKPVKVVLRFDAGVARDASEFLFHPDQIVETNDDGTVTVRFEAGGIGEMCWHLFTWGESVTIEKPARLRKHLAKMCQSLSAHHRVQA